MSNIAVLTATKFEVPHCIQCTEKINPQIIGKGNSVSLAISGLGQTRMKRTVTLIDQTCDLIIHTGICGSASPGLKVGDILLVNKVKYNGNTLDIDSKLVQRVEKLLKVCCIPYAAGQIETFNNVVTSKGGIANDVLGVDMESYAFVEAVQMQQKPFCVVKVISDVLPSHSMVGFRRLRLLYEVIKNFNLTSRRLDEFMSKFLIYNQLGGFK